MDIFKVRVLSTKSFDTGVTSRTVLRNGLPFSTEMLAKYGSTDRIKSSFLPSDIILNSRNTLIKEAEKLGVDLGNSMSLDSLLNSVDISKLSSPRSNLSSVFPHTNPLTGKLDIDLSSDYISTIPAVVLSGVIPTQRDLDKREYFNPDGVVSRAEFIDMLSKAGTLDTGASGTSVDKLVTAEDYFCQGYNSLVQGYSSPLYRLYTREELSESITRGELAYILVLCNKSFRGDASIFGGEFTVGLYTDWEKPQRYMSLFEDGKSLKLTRRKVDTIIDGQPTNAVLEIDLRKYKGEKSMSEYIESIRIGKSLLPVPVFMSLVELSHKGVFKYDDGRLSPLKEVSRLEMSYLVTKLLECSKGGV